MVALRQSLHRALRGSQSRAALEILDREEDELPHRGQWAVADRQFQAAAALGQTFRDYLERSGRLRERDAWVQWLKDAVTQQGFTAEAAAYEVAARLYALYPGRPAGRGGAAPGPHRAPPPHHGVRSRVSVSPGARGFGQDLGRRAVPRHRPSPSCGSPSDFGRRWWRKPVASPGKQLLSTPDHARGRDRTGEPLRHDGRSGQCAERCWPARRGFGRRGEGFEN